MAEEFFGEMFTGADDALQQVMLDFLSDVEYVADEEAVRQIFGRIASLYSSMMSQVANGKTGDASKSAENLRAELLELEDMFGLNVGDSWVKLLIPVLQEAGQAAEEATVKVKDFWAEMRSQSHAKWISDQEDNDWKTFTDDMQQYLGKAAKGDSSSLQYAINSYRLMADDVQKSISSSLPWLADFFLYFENGDYSIENVTAAMAFWNSQLTEETEQFKAINAELEKIQTASQLREWQGEGFSSVIDDLKGFLSPEGEMNYEGFMGILDRITEAGALDEFSDV